jgi:hypothetical protein
MPVVEIDQELVEHAHVLRQRAHSLRHQADALDAVLANAYRRRASELEIEAWVTALQAGLPYDQVEPAAA